MIIEVAFFVAEKKFRPNFLIKSEDDVSDFRDDSIAGRC